MIRSEPTPISFRSVSEQRAATALLLKEGQWNAEAQSFLTRETQLQEVSRHFSKQHQLLRVSPALLYSSEGRDLNAVYPQCPRELLHNYHVEASKLGEADPNPSHIREISEVLSRRKTEKKASNNNDNHNNNNKQNNNNEQNGGNENDGEDEEEGDADSQFAQSTTFGASAQDARAQLESDFLGIASQFAGGQNSNNLFSSQQYSRPNPFMSGSHSKRPTRDRGFVSTRRSVLANQDNNGFDGGDNNNNNGDETGFFMTDMSDVRQGRGGGNNSYDEQQQQDGMTAHQLALSQSKLLNSSQMSSGSRQNNSSGGVKLPSIHNNNNQNHQYGRNVSPIRARTLANATAFSSPTSPIQMKRTPNKYFQGIRGGVVDQTPTPNRNTHSSLNRNREPVYSSLLHELRSTRQEVEEEAKRCSTLQAISNLGGTPEFRRTVTRIFANPEDADRISDEEMRRRQKLYDKLSKQQQRMDQEAEAAIGSSTLNMSRFGGGGGGGSRPNQLNQSTTGNTVGQDAVAAFERDMAAVASKLSM